MQQTVCSQWHTTVHILNYIRILRILKEWGENLPEHKKHFAAQLGGLAVHWGGPVLIGVSLRN